MATNKVFLDLEGLTTYDQLVKNYVDVKTESNSTEITQEIASESDRAKQAEEALQTALNTLASASNKADEEIKADVKTNTEAIAVLNGDAATEGSVAKQVQDAVDNIVASAPETFDTLKEIADWISNDETGSAALINRMSSAEENISNNTTNIANNTIKINDLKAYVDAQDTAYYNSINSINNIYISSLFKTEKPIEEGQTVSDALASLGANEKLVLNEDSEITEDIAVPAGATIDANGSTFSGTITVPEDAVIYNAVFTGKVTVG